MNHLRTTRAAAKHEKPAAAPVAPVATNISDPFSAGAQASKLKLLKRPRPSVVDADSSDSDLCIKNPRADGTNGGVVKEGVVQGFLCHQSFGT